MSAALEDPSLEIAYRVGPGPVPATPTRTAAAWPSTGSGPARSVTRVYRDGEPIAAIVHDPALGERSELVDAAGTAALLVLDQQRLDAQLRASVRELRTSQARILAAADVERQRIERDLHDGAQQRLVALRMKLELMNELRSTDPARAAALETELGGEIDGALDEIRGLARGIYPPLLASHGLGEALYAVAVRCPVHTTVLVDGDRRCWARSRARSTSAAVRPCRTWPSTRKARPARPFAWSGTTADRRSRSTTTAPASTWSARTPVPAS